jgi:HEAT repeat protein
LLLLEDLTSVLLWFFATIVCVNFVFLCFVFYRRFARARYYRIKDAARQRYEGVVATFLAGRLTVEQATGLLEGATTRPERDLLQELLLAGGAQGNEMRTSELLYTLGFVEQWARQAFGARRARQAVQRGMRREKTPESVEVARSLLNPFRSLRILAIPRALAVNQLGHLAPEFSHSLCTEALRDPSAEVRRTAVTAMGRNRLPAAIPLLVQELARVVAQPSGLSLRTVKTALVAYRLEDLPAFVPFLTHPQPRVRFFLVDPTREISQRAARRLPLNKNDFSQEFYAVFLERLVQDSFADVRARSAAVVRHFRDRRAEEALRGLLADENEFVRLHAARACADRFYAGLTPDLVRLMRDPRWRVREAATQALRAFGGGGLKEVYQQFVESTDRYMCEQVAEEFQRQGIVRELVGELAGGGDAHLAQDVCKKLVLMQKTSLLTNAMVSPGVPPEARAMIMDALTLAPPPEFYPLLQYIIENDKGPLGFKAESILHSSGVHDSGLRGKAVRDSGVRKSGIRDSGVRKSGVHDSGVRKSGKLKSGLSKLFGRSKDDEGGGPGA